MGTRELLILKHNKTGFRCRDLASGETLSIKTAVDGSIPVLDTMNFSVTREWQFNKTRYLSGTVSSSQFIRENLPAAGHEYTSCGIWDPRESYGSDADDLFGEYLSGRMLEEYRFEDHTGFGFYGKGRDLVSEAVGSDSMETRYDLLAGLWEDYPQCIDALVHIGHMYFDSKWLLRNSMNCYQGSVYIAEKNMPEGFEGMFRWSHLENRPYLRALHGLCLIYWKSGDFAGAHEIASKLLRICPEDDLGIRFIIEEIAGGVEYSEDE